MKTRKRICAIAISALLTLSVTGCALVREILPLEQNTAFTVGYDYDMHVEGKATLLLNGSFPFFDFEEYGVAPLLAGDELTVYYVGTIYTLESYPGQVQLRGRITKVEKTYSAQIVGNCYKEGEQVRNESGLGFINLPEYAICEDGSCVEFFTLADGTELFVAYATPHEPGVDVNIDAQRLVPTALYTYDPRA